MSGDTLVARSSKLGRSLVASEEGQRIFTVQIKRSLKGWKQRQKCLFEAGDGSALVGDEVAATSEEKLQFGDLFFTCSEFAKVCSHASLVGDYMCISGVGLGLAAVGVAGSVYAEARDVEDPLITFPQQRQQECRTTSWLIYCPHDLFRQKESIINELGDVCFVILDPAGEQLLSRSVQHMSPVKLFASVNTRPGLVHRHLHPSATSSPSEYPADSSLPIATL
jgi:hypothetical protein